MNQDESGYTFLAGLLAIGGVLWTQDSVRELDPVLQTHLDDVALAAPGRVGTQNGLDGVPKRG
jgi:hypothetical protein